MAYGIFGITPHLYTHFQLFGASGLEFSNLKLVLYSPTFYCLRYDLYCSWTDLLAEEKQGQHLDILARRLHSMYACRERSEGAFCHESSAVTGHKLHKQQMQTP